MEFIWFETYLGDLKFKEEAYRVGGPPKHWLGLSWLGYFESSPITYLNTIPSCVRTCCSWIQRWPGSVSLSTLEGADCRDRAYWTSWDILEPDILDGIKNLIDVRLDGLDRLDGTLDGTWFCQRFNKVHRWWEWIIVKLRDRTRKSFLIWDWHFSPSLAQPVNLGTSQIKTRPRRLIGR